MSLLMDSTVSGRVHINVDAWFSKYGQEHMFFMVHWDSLLVTGKGAGWGMLLELVGTIMCLFRW